MKKSEDDDNIMDTVTKTIEFNQLRVQLNDYHRRIQSSNIIIHPHPSQLVYRQNQELQSRKAVQPYQSTSWFGSLFSFFSSSDDSTYIINV